MRTCHPSLALHLRGQAQVMCSVSLGDPTYFILPITQHRCNLGKEQELVQVHMGLHRLLLS